MVTIQEKYEESINTFKKEIIEMVQHMYAENKEEFAPIVFGLILKDGKLGIAVMLGLGEMMTSPEGKRQAAQAIKEIGDKIKPIAIAFACEGYMTIHKASTPLTAVDKDGNLVSTVLPPSKDPNRIEALMINFETHDKSAFRHWEIDKKRALHSTLPGKDWMPKDPTEEGIFTNLLTTNNTELADFLKEQLKTNMN